MNRLNIKQAIVSMDEDCFQDLLGILRNLEAGGNLKELLAAYKRQTAQELGWLYARQTPARRRELLEDAKTAGLGVSFNLDMLGTPNTMSKNHRQEGVSHG